jgi:hypothetical protein
MLAAGCATVLLIALIAWTRAANGDQPPPFPPGGPPVTGAADTVSPSTSAPAAPTATVTVPDRKARRYAHRLARRLTLEHRRLLTARRHVTVFRHRVAALTHTLHTDSSVGEAINLACTVYGDCATLWRRASCETGGTYNPHAYNHGSHASGLFQFEPATWQSTPFGRFNIWSPYPNALAAGWMNSHGRGGEWACR